MKHRNPIPRLFLRGSMEIHAGRIDGLPVSEPVEVLRDRWGIPHIFARTERDLFVAQGFVHAQDRLWQMESLRRLCSGTLAAVVGEAAVNLDVFSRMVGLPAIWRRALGALDAGQRDLAQAYADGVNAFLGRAGRELPLEFRSMGFAPAPWTVDDLYAFVPYLAWNQQGNYLEEILALLAHDRVTAAQWNELYPSHPGSKAPEEPFFAAYRGARFGALLPASLALFPRIQGAVGGSNAFAVARGDGGLPVLANDPHLGVSVPPAWYFCHLSCPTLEVAGASVPGTTGVVIGRNRHVSWGYTAVMADYVDLYAVRVDPAHPTSYFVRGERRDMTRQELTIEVRGARARTVTVHCTEFGPVITTLDPGVDAAACLMWYGTLADGVLPDGDIPSHMAALKSTSVADAVATASGYTSTCFNLNCADTQGHVGWHAMGSMPVRKGYTGRVPADGSSGECRWAGFLRYREMPGAVDPPEGFFVTANQRTQTDAEPVPMSWSWCAPDRYHRIRELLQGLEHPTASDLAGIQMDDWSPQAKRLLPLILAETYDDPRARWAASALETWDMRMSVDSTPALVFGVLMVEASEVIAQNALGEHAGIYLTTSGYLYNALDRLAEKRPGNPLLAEMTTRELWQESLIRTVRYIRSALGPRRSGWTWGRLHTYSFRHLGASGGLASWMLNRGRYPAPGCGATVNVGLSNPAHGRGALPSPLERHEAGVIPSLRMVCPMADVDGTLIAGPMGQSGQAGSRHYDDLGPLWRAGRRVPLPLSREGAERVAVARLVLAGATTRPSRSDT